MLVVMLVSVLDGRFRYSDEANTDLGGIPLLGILPNLPDLLTDPSQAATAAHCVHQIRTILQITGHNTEKRVFTITSGSPGDGKTSLTLALGLSFAASGSRTLLVDGDMIGGGLTVRLNVNAEHGVLEAMARATSRRSSAPPTWRICRSCRSARPWADIPARFHRRRCGGWWTRPASNST